MPMSPENTLLVEAALLSLKQGDASNLYSIPLYDPHGPALFHLQEPLERHGDIDLSGRGPGSKQHEIRPQFRRPHHVLAAVVSTTGRFDTEIPAGLDLSEPNREIWRELVASADVNKHERRGGIIGLVFVGDREKISEMDLDALAPLTREWIGKGTYAISSILALPFKDCLKCTRPQGDIQRASDEVKELVLGYLNKPEVCTICSHQCEEPVQLACGHRFCHVCIAIWLKCTAACPTCKSPSDPARLQRKRKRSVAIDLTVDDEPSFLV